MKLAHRLRAHWLLVCLVCAAAAHAAEEFAFDTSAFEKKAFELGGYGELKYEEFRFNTDGVFYQLNRTQRETLGRVTGTLQLVGTARPGIGTFDFRTNSTVAHDQLDGDHDNKFFDAAWSFRPDPGVTLEAGKRGLRWGKGYAWNPIAFVERPKDPNEPTLAREGYWVAHGDFIFNPGGNLQTVAFTPVLLPVRSEINSDFGATGHLNPAAKLYLLYRDTDIDFAWQGKGSRPARFGMDFSRNVFSNFEIHGEWAHIFQATRPLVDGTGRVTTDIGDATSYLLGLRYLTAGDTTYIAEYYRNGTGYSEPELQQFYLFADTALGQLTPPVSSALQQKALSLSRSAYGRPQAGRDYLYFRAQQKDAFGIVYFQPAITAIVNWQDRSFQVTPELSFTGINNLELRARLSLLHGAAGTDFGEKPNSRKLEVYARYYF